MVGYTRGDLEAGRMRWDAITPPEYLPQDREHIAEAQERGGCPPYEKEYIRKDGSRVPILVGYSLVGEARQDAVAFVLDLSDRKQAEAALRQYTDRLEFVLEANQLGTWEVNLQTQPYVASPRSLRHDQIYGYDALVPDWSYDTFLTHIHPEDRLRVESTFQQTLETHNPWDVECRIFRADGASRWVWISGSVSFDESRGNP
ncbi:MAG: PAS domain-containing protein [Leptolyngbyaceae cyanobacterium SM2_3_12]|nr:PAS domain-containing protein [Leptolyngbyaceae cyanobacterium SM2_3_12]